jgi:putative sulfotransferase
MPETAPPPGPCSIVINSGRCGSTLLSRLIAQEPETLSASESLGPIRDRLRRQTTGEITGASYWAIMSDTRNRVTPMLRLGITAEQFCYPDDGRYAGDVTTVPPILRITLPFLSADPDGLFDQLAERVPHFPRQPILQHHKMMLNLMANLTGRRRWVERSGASSIVASPLLFAFPEAKIVYLTRNIADTARSMSRHPAFQLAEVREWFRLQYGADPWTPDGQNALPDAAEVPEKMRRLMPGRITKEALMDVMIGDIGRFEALASHMHGSAEQALADMKPRHLHRLRYEDLVARPLDELTKLGEFLEFADPHQWAARTANQVSRSPRTRSTQPA